MAMLDGDYRGAGGKQELGSSIKQVGVGQPRLCYVLDTQTRTSPGSGRRRCQEAALVCRYD
jgi:hypothetical protein